jgi:hypothetical protein
MIELRYRKRRAGMDSRTHIARTRFHGSSAACMALALALVACGESTHSVGHLKAASTMSPGAGPSMPGGDDDDDSSGAAASMSGSGSGSHPGSSGQSDPGGTGSVGPGEFPTIPLDGGAGAVPAFDAGHVEPIVPPVCSGGPTTATRRELDLYLMVDTNITIPPMTWANLLRGLKRYVADPRANGTGVGIGFLGFGCVMDSYKMATVGVGMLPGNRDAIETAIDRAPAFNLSPLLAAIQGSLLYARSYASTYPSRKIALVLVTDSITDSAGCGDVTSLTKAVTDGRTGSPAIQTYVLAVVDGATFQLTIQIPIITNPTLASSAIGPLNQIAAAGGSAQAYAYNPAAEGDANQPSPFVDSMLKLQHAAEPCDYAVPDGVPDDMAGTWLLVNGSIDPLTRLDSESDCGDGYSVIEADGVRFAHLCSNTCADVKNAHVDLSWVAGCPATP